MSESPDPPSMPASPSDPWTWQKQRAWLRALVLAIIMLTVLGWLLARLVWIYNYFGLFFFLVAGLLVGAFAFRTARIVRPIEASRLVRTIAFITLCNMLIIIVWEYRHFAATVGTPPRFAEARNAAVAAGRPPVGVLTDADDAFNKYLGTAFPPGGVIGYIRWSVMAGECKITVGGVTETITSDHKGWIWPVRTTFAAALLFAGLWFSLESLRSPTPVTNFLRPGEEGEEVT